MDLKGKGYNWPGKKVLIVEDDPSNILYLNKLLEKASIDALVAENGRKAIELVKENEDIDLILMDIQLPGINGLETTVEIKKIRSSIPVIAQTAFALVGDKEKILEAGCDAYLAKPILIEDLFQMMKQYLG